MARRAKQALEDKQGEDVILVDVKDLSTVTDYVLIATGFSPPHLKALFGEVQQVMKKDGVVCYRKSGAPEGGWLTLDYIDVVIHIFSVTARRYYAIEEMWPAERRLS